MTHFAISILKRMSLLPFTLKILLLMTLMCSNIREKLISCIKITAPSHFAEYKNMMMG